MMQHTPHQRLRLPATEPPAATPPPALPRIPLAAELQETDPSPEQETLQRAQAMQTLCQAKAIHQTKQYELMIDHRTRIMVEKKNFNKAYAQAYKARMNSQR